MSIMEKLVRYSDMSEKIRDSAMMMRALIYIKHKIYKNLCA